jgi:hypothetical protein
MVTLWGVRGPSSGCDKSPAPGDVYEAEAEMLLGPIGFGADTTFLFNFGTGSKFGWTAFGVIPKND